MGIVAPPQRIASAFTVFFGHHGDVSRYAQERGVCRQWVYREATGDTKLPALKLPDGTVLAHSRAILAWISRQS